MATVGLGRAAIYQMQREGKPVKIGVRAVGWIAEDVLAWIARRANREITASVQFSEEDGQQPQPRTGPTSQAHSAEDLLGRKGRRRMSQHGYQELERLRAVEQRLRQVTQLLGEIAALLAAPVYRE